MKSPFYYLIVLATLVASACSVKERQDDSRLLAGMDLSFSAEVVQEATTKTGLQDNGTVWWTPGDAICVYFGDSSGDKFTSTNEEPVARAVFHGTISSFTGVTESGDYNYFWAVYPFEAAVSCDGNQVTAQLSDEQVAQAGSFAPNTNITLAKSPGLALSFYNVCSGMWLTVTKEGITSVTFEGNNGEDVAGTFQVSMSEGDTPRPTAPVVTEGKKSVTLRAPQGETLQVGERYFIMVLPQVFTNGVTLTFNTALETGSRSYSSELNFARSTYLHSQNADQNVAYELIDPNSYSQYLTFTSEGTTTLSLTNYGGNAPVLYYSTDKTKWAQWDYSALSFSAEEPLYLCGNNPEGIGHSRDAYSTFTAQGDRFGITGSIMSLIDNDNEVLAIPAGENFDNCFKSLFNGCQLLVTAPELPATTLAGFCYYSMFSGCTGLVAAPDLPATTLASRCYRSMFEGCTGLVAAPVLPAETLEPSCYYMMFSGCSSLNYVKCLATNISAQDCVGNWLSGVAVTGVFVQATSMSAWQTGASGIPAGWAVISDSSVPSGGNEGTGEEDWN